MKSIAYMMAAFNLYTGPNSVVSNPMRGGLTNAASRLDIQVGKFAEKTCPSAP